MPCPLIYNGANDGMGEMSGYICEYQYFQVYIIQSDFDKHNHKKHGFCGLYSKK